MIPDDDADPASRRAPVRALDAAEARGKVVLFYEPGGVLGGTFTCARCAAVAAQPDLLSHAPSCRYAAAGSPITVW